MKLEKLEALISKLMELHQAHPAVQPAPSAEPPELELHRYVKHVYANRWYIEISGNNGVKFSFGNGKDENATFLKEGIFLDLENAANLVRDTRKWLMAAGQPDPIPQDGPVRFDQDSGHFVITVGQGGGGGAGHPGHQGGGGAAGPVFTGRTGAEAQAAHDKWAEAHDKWVEARAKVLRAHIDDWLERRPEWTIAKIEETGRRPFTVTLRMAGGFEVVGEGDTEAQAIWAAIRIVHPDAAIE